jgi:hypothetical protein
MNIIAKQEGQAMVAKRDPQNWQSGASEEVAAPQFGQLSVSACIHAILPVKKKKRSGSARNPVSSRPSETSTGGAALLAREAAGKIQASKNFQCRQNNV